MGDLFGAGGLLALDQTKRRAVQIEQIVDINGAVAEDILKCECIAEREGGCIDNTLQFGAHISWRVAVKFSWTDLPLASQLSIDIAIYRGSTIPDRRNRWNAGVTPPRGGVGTIYY